MSYRTEKVEEKVVIENACLSCDWCGEVVRERVDDRRGGIGFKGARDAGWHVLVPYGYDAPRIEANFCTSCSAHLLKLKKEKQRFVDETKARMEKVKKEILEKLAATE